MKNTRKKILLWRVLAGGGCIVTGLAQAGTLATVIVENQTSAAASYTFEHLFGSANPVPREIEVNETFGFIVTSGSDIASGMRFTYGSGSKKCRFSASHAGTPSMGGYVPSWKKDAQSIGSSRATCTATWVKLDSTLPFNYTVKFTIK